VPLLCDEAVRHLPRRHSKVNERLVGIRPRPSLQTIELNQIFHGSFALHNDFSQFVSSDVAVDLRIGRRISRIANVLQYYSESVLLDEFVVFVCVVVCVLYLCSN
jgi:hypothetical protein